MVFCNKFIDIDKIVDLNYFDFWDFWFNMLVVLKLGKEEFVYKSFKYVFYLYVYCKNEVLVVLYFRNNRCILWFVVVLCEGWVVSFSKGRFIKSFLKMGFVYGYSCMCKFMFIVFIVCGFVFKKGFVGKFFEFVSLYFLMCKILGFEFLWNNGSLNDI